VNGASSSRTILAYNQSHATDMQMISHYRLKGQIIVVSMVEQALRLYRTKLALRARWPTAAVKRVREPLTHMVTGLHSGGILNRAKKEVLD